mmetsp:Transcript_27092/g.49430  ORF Transcript_27092/g.49430 Transcript_27092/m.49430 type:complete len:80 (+) Transcript_27092:259-498(+)
MVSVETVLVQVCSGDLIKVGNLQNLNKAEIADQKHEREKYNRPYQNLAESRNSCGHNIQMIQSLEEAEKPDQAEEAKQS